MHDESIPLADVCNGDHCRVVRGTHAGNSGIVRDRHVSATGQVTITIEQPDGGRFKTLARSVSVLR